MPNLDTSLHLDMLRAGRKRRSLVHRIKKAVEHLFAKRDIYGIEWGDPETVPPLTYIRDHFLMPYVTPDTAMVEIGVGGGRWTRYMHRAKTIYAVDFHQELLDELKANVDASNVTFVHNNGDDFPGIPPQSIDFVFSFGTFVHLDLDIIDRYLANMRPLLKPASNVVIHYSDKTKPLAISNEGFSDNDPEKMRVLVSSHGYRILEEDVKSMWHSSVIRFALA